MKKALITGVGGQDGSYLAELLMRLGYEVHGLTRRAAPESLLRISHLSLSTGSSNQSGRLKVHTGDMTDLRKMKSLVEEIRPDEIYNLAAQSHILTSHQDPKATDDVNSKAALDLLEVVRLTSPRTRFYQASSSEMFGNAPGPQNEETPFKPQTPYGESKLSAHNACNIYREKYGLFVASGILFNHESPRRSELFVTRKITKTAALIHKGLASSLELGDLEASRDWGYAPDYVFAMWKMLQIDTPQDFVIATGKSNRVKNFVEAAFSFFDLDWREYTRINPAFLRPTTVSASEGDTSQAKKLLGWEPTVNFSELVSIMCEAEAKGFEGPYQDVPRSSLWPGSHYLRFQERNP